MEGIIYSILIGLVAGFLGNLIFKGSGSGLFINLAVGLVGGVLGGVLASLLGIGGGGVIWQIIIATAGSILLLWFASAINN